MWTTILTLTSSIAGALAVLIPLAMRIVRFLSRLTRLDASLHHQTETQRTIMARLDQVTTRLETVERRYRTPPNHRR